MSEGIRPAEFGKWRWTYLSSIRVTPKKPLPRTFNLVIEYDGVYDSVIGESVEVIVSGMKQTFIASSHPTSISLKFECLDPNSIIEIYIKSATSPKDFGVPTGIRKLGIRIIAMYVQCISL